LLLAKSPIVVWLVVGLSEVNRLNSSGAATVLWEIPAHMENILDVEDPK